MQEKVINHCSEYECPANEKGQCKISICILIDPKQAVKELEELKCH